MLAVVHTLPRDGAAFVTALNACDARLL